MSDRQEQSQILIFCLDERRFGLPLHQVSRVVRAVEITPIPRAPDVVMGVVDVQGEIVPIFNIRRRFALPERVLSITDQFIIARLPTHVVGLCVDFTSGVIDGAPISAAGFLNQPSQIEGVVQLPDGLLLIHDLRGFLTAAETRQLETALSQEAA